MERHTVYGADKKNTKRSLLSVLEVASAVEQCDRCEEPMKGSTQASSAVGRPLQKQAQEILNANIAIMGKTPKPTAGSYYSVNVPSICFASWDELAMLYASTLGDTEIDEIDDHGVRAMGESNVGVTGMGYPPSGRPGYRRDCRHVVRPVQQDMAGVG